MGPVCLIIQGQFEEPAWPWSVSYRTLQRDTVGVSRVFQGSLRTSPLRPVLPRRRAVRQRQRGRHTAAVAEHRRTHVRPLEVRPAGRHVDGVHRQQRRRQRCRRQGRSLGGHLSSSARLLSAIFRRRKLPPDKPISKRILKFYEHMHYHRQKYTKARISSNFHVKYSLLFY